MTTTLNCTTSTTKTTKTTCKGARQTALHRNNTAQHFGVDGNGSDHDGCEQYRDDDDNDVQRAQRRGLHDGSGHAKYDA